MTDYITTISGKGFLYKICSIEHQSGSWTDQATKFWDHPRFCVTPMLIPEQTYYLIIIMYIKYIAEIQYLIMKNLSMFNFITGNL